jgi:SAM-dependent methyltransferase
MTDYYTDKFFKDITAGSKRSAEIVLPLVFSEIKPKSIVDIGCGTGTWLSAAKENDVSDVLGLDGDYVNSNLQIKPGEFKATDISEGFLLDKRYDLALCLEVGEHISNKKSSILVDSLTKATDVILFSAAIPGQGGIHHINEQWPDFWQRLFQDRNFVCIDCIRPMIYNNPEVEWWYRQNIFLYVNRKVLIKFPRLEAQKNQANDILLLHRSLLKKRYGLLNSFLYLFKLPIAKVAKKMGFRK